MEAPARPRWRAQLEGWRGWLFALLGLYVLGAAVFLLAGGARPAMTSLMAMEEEVEADETDVTQNPATTASATSPGTAAAPVSVSDSEPEPLSVCSDIDPVSHSVDPSLEGVHALGFLTLDEEPASFAGYVGCPLIVNFFASWCVPCVTEMPDFERFWNAHGTSVAVLGLAANDRLEDAIETVEERGVTYPTGLDEGDLFIDFGGLGMPTTVFVSPDGDILETHSGLLTLDDITDRAEEHFGL
ncbi:TlpA family protein disulfide reductase [Candidatus Poriferisodalis sp.]|uniref:TlpA family protein disulfide reductase n=1 Tax=Candidatus Poriferisodalis sp. TaxID=3101277 RepID=UPI003B01D9CD